MINGGAILKKKKIYPDLLQPFYKDLYDIWGEDKMLEFHDTFGGAQIQCSMKLYNANSLGKHLENLNPTEEDAQKLSIQFGYTPRWQLDKSCSK